MTDPSPNLIIGDADGGRLSENIMHFGRVLREAGLPVGPGSVLDAIKAVSTVGVSSRADFYWALHAVFVNRRDQRDIFDQAFHFFWKNPDLLNRMMTMLLPSFKGDQAAEEKSAMSKRLSEALSKDGNQPDREEDNDEDEDEETEQFDLDSTLTFSKQEVLATKDFEKMSVDEFTKAKSAISKLTLPLGLVQTRRFQTHLKGQRADLRKTLRDAAKYGSDMIFLKKKRRKSRPPPLVILCDISGSMDRYSRILLHFMHTLTNDRDRVDTFLFGTRLTNITRYLRARDPDDAIDKVSQTVVDWAGGTRIGQCLQDFNKNWGRRVLGQGAVVLLITDGLDRDGAVGLEDEIERLHKSCRRLIWLNPLLRYDAYAPKALGAKALIKHVDDFRPIHNLESLGQLAEALNKDSSLSQVEMASWKGKAA